MPRLNHNSPNYEPHIMENNLLPFIFHTDTRTRSNVPCYPNWHENIEILVHLSGAGHIRCDNAEYPFGPGDIFVINSDTLHSTESSDHLIYHCLIIDNSFFEANGLPISGLHFQEHITDPALHTAFQSIVSAIQNPSGSAASPDVSRISILQDGFVSQNGNRLPLSPYQTALIRHAVLGFAILLYQNYSETQTAGMLRQSVSKERVKKVMTYLRQNLENPISLDAIASCVGISKYHLSREFKELTGITIFDCLNLLRCRAAMQMLLSGSTVAEAAGASGFENLSYFSRTFKRCIGKLPSDCLVK